MTSNKKIKITQFLDSHCIKWFPVKLNKKVPTRNDFYDGQPTSKWFAEKTDGEIKELHKHLNEFDHIAIDLSRVRHVDVDFVDGVDYKTEEPEAYIFEKKLRKNLPYYKSISKAKGKHYFTTHDFDTSNNGPKPIFGKHWRCEMAVGLTAKQPPMFTMQIQTWISCYHPSCLLAKSNLSMLP